DVATRHRASTLIQLQQPTPKLWLPLASDHRSDRPLTGILRVGRIELAQLLKGLPLPGKRLLLFMRQPLVRRGVTLLVGQPTVTLNDGTNRRQPRPLRQALVILQMLGDRGERVRQAGGAKILVDHPQEIVRSELVVGPLVALPV